MTPPRTVLDRALAYAALVGLLLAILFWSRAPARTVRIEARPDAAPPFVVDLNHDSWERISLIAGIGETLARRIVSAREARGGFDSLEEVMQVSGVPDPPLERARPWLVLGEMADRDG